MTDPKQKKDIRRVPGPKERRPVIPSTFQISRVSPMRQILDEAEGAIPRPVEEIAPRPAAPATEPPAAEKGSVVPETTLVEAPSPVPETSLVTETSPPAPERVVTETSPVTETTPSAPARVVTETRLVNDQMHGWSETRLVTETSPVSQTSLVTETSPNSVDLIASLPDVDGYLQMPNRVVDHLLPLLSPNSQLVYFRLYRLSWGFGKPFCMVSLPKLAEKTQLSQSSVQRSIADLEKKGLIRKAERIFGKSKAQGVTYEVVSVTSLVTETSPVRKTSPVRETTNKHVLKETNKGDFSEQPIYEVRKIALRFREIHRGDSSYSLDQLRTDVRTALAGQARDIDDQTIDEGLRGITL